MDSNFDLNKIPYDYIYMDIDHTDSMKYFTFKQEDYPDVAAMFQTFHNKGRKCVCIIDCHIKKDEKYYVYQ